MKFSFLGLSTRFLLVCSSIASATPQEVKVAPPAPAAESAEIRLPDAVPSWTTRRGLSAELSTAIGAAFEEEALHGQAVGLSLAVLVEDSLVELRHRGWEDVAAGIPVTSATSYRWASISKPMTAVAALQLVESGRLDLAADVRKYVPEFPTKPWPVSIEQLLCHQGGIVHYTNGVIVPLQRTYDTEHPFADPINALDRFMASPLIAEPGTRYSYTTHGYLLLGAVVQRAGEAPFADQVRTRILEPLGMTSTRPDQPWVEIPHRTQGYRPTRAGYARLDTYEDVHWKLAGGGWTSTIEDLARFGVGLLNGQLLKPESLVNMTTSRIPQGAEDPHYGLGIGVGEFDGHVVWQHSGSQSQTATYMLLCPERKLGVIVMCNTRGFQPVKLARRVLGLL